MRERPIIVGVHPTSTDQSMNVIDLGREAAARGLHSISLPEHTHIPVGSNVIRTDWTMPERYKRTLDPFIASAFVAATTTLEVGSAISLIAQHDAIALAKAIATIDHLSDGRFMLGVGFGYNRAEAADHGMPPEARSTIVEETVRLMRALWTNDEASFEGQFRRLPPSWSWPKPARPGGPPVLLGARATPRNFERIATWADGWIPMGSGVTAEGFESDLHELRARWKDAGRTPDVQVCCFFQPGSASDMAREIEQAMELGVQRMEIYVEDRPRDSLLPLLDDLCSSIDQWS